MIEKMSREQEDKIVSVVEDLLRKNRGTPGFDVNSELVKVSSAESFTAPIVERIAEAFNVARSIGHFKSASDKTASFALADAKIVLDAMYPSEPETTVKTATRCNVVQLKRQPLQKAAAARIPDDPALILKKYKGEVDELTKLAEGARLSTSMFKEALNKCVSDLKLYFRSPVALCMDDVEYNARGCFGEEKVAALMSAVRTKPYRFTKAAGVMCVDTSVEPYATLARAVHLMGQLVDASATSDMLKTSAAAFKQSYSAACKDVYKKKAALDDIGKMPKEVADMMQKVPSAQQSFQSSIEKLDLPDIRAKSDALNMQVALYDMLNYDPVLSKASIEDVIAAYNDIVSVAPAMAQNTGMLRSALREHVASKGMGAFEVKNLVDTSKSYHEGTNKPLMDALSTYSNLARV